MADPEDPPQGGTPQDPPAEDPPADATPQEPPAEPDEIKTLRRENASWRTKLRESEAALEAVKTQGATELETAVATAREEAKQEAFVEALTEANARIVQAEILAAAAGKFANPALAAPIIGTSSFTVNEKGEVDRAAIAAAIDEALKKDPYLAGSRDPDFGARPPASRNDSGDMDAWMRSQAAKK